MYEDFGEESRPPPAEKMAARLVVSQAETTGINRVFFRLATSGEMPASQLNQVFMNLIVNKHGGRIEVESEVGKGTTFTVHLPVEPQVSE